MAYLIRSIAVIGVIAFHSPTHQRAPEAPPELAALAQERDTALAGIATAREAAAALAALDPQTRQAVLAMLTASIARTIDPGQPTR